MPTFILARGRTLHLAGVCVNRIGTDRAKIKLLWSSIDSAFWSDEDDPSIRVLKIVPSVAEYWDRGGAIASTVKMVRGALTGSQPDLRVELP